MSRKTNEYQTIRSEGGLLPTDLLRRVLDTKGDLEGASSVDYGLPAGDRLNEVITRSWNQLNKYWVGFHREIRDLQDGASGTRLTNEKWNLPLLKELGFGMLPTSPGPEIDGKVYPINRFLGPVPIHLIGCGLNLDRRTAGARGAATTNPHGLVQEFLNRSDDHLWAIISNGKQLRILRDNQALSRQCYLEFDLENMFEGEVYSDFVLLWMTAHASRFMLREEKRPESCWLEEWTKVTEEQGTRALGDLKVGVEKALQVLGEGFTSHPKNTAIRDLLRGGEISPNALHGQLLRIIYRLIFLFVAEDRYIDGESLLHPPDDSDSAKLARERYASYYSTTQLREVASKIKGSKHGDLWIQFQLITGCLSNDANYSESRKYLALPELGSFLWNETATHELSQLELTNFDFLEVIRNLAFTRQGKLLRPVDYKNLGAEELGGVYESLLELTPQISADGARFNFAEFAGSERKTSGSYYTPDSLVQCLLDSALEPVIEEAIKGKSGSDAEKAILDLKVCDPAVGSGHFLVGAAHRLAQHLARFRAIQNDESDPSPKLYQQAVRDVVGNCLYGVDINPMAAELCRVGLWLEAMEPGKPLSFLDHHLQVGNSLLGATPKKILGGIPDSAFQPAGDDDKEVCKYLKKLNIAEKKGWGPLFQQNDELTQARLFHAASIVEQIKSDNPDNIIEKENAYRQFKNSEDYLRNIQIANLWCASFFVNKRNIVAGDNKSAVGFTQFHLYKVLENEELQYNLSNELVSLCDEYKVFHWHLEFPEIYARGGFDCVLGNPPWDKIKLQEREWFSTINPTIANAKTSSDRETLIAQLKIDDPQQFNVYSKAIQTSERLSIFYSTSGRYPLGSVGDINTYPLFTELSMSLLNQSGRIGIIVKTGILSDYNMRGFFAEFVKNSNLISAYDFSNKKLIFKDVVANERFTLLTISGVTGNTSPAIISILNEKIEQLKDTNRQWKLTPNDAKTINPNTLTCPLFQNKETAEIIKYIYNHHTVITKYIGHEISNPWGIGYTRLFDMTNDSKLFVDQEYLENLTSSALSGSVNVGDETYEAVLEGKLFNIYNHRYGDFDGVPRNKRFGRKAEPNHPNTSQLANPSYSNLPRYWISTEYKEERYQRKLEFIPGGVLAFRDVCRTHTDSRTVRASICPAYCAGNKAPLILFPGSNIEGHAIHSAILCSCLNTFVFDFIARQKFSGGSLNKFILEQLPVISPELILKSHFGLKWFISRILELIYTSYDLRDFACQCGYSLNPFRWDEDRRFEIRCELDAAFFYLYFMPDQLGYWRNEKKYIACDYHDLKKVFPKPRDAINYIMDSFPIIRGEEEKSFNGDYKTKRAILEIYDEMIEAIRTGTTYKTRLDPPPADPSLCHLPKGGLRPEGEAYEFVDLLSTDLSGKIVPVRLNDQENNDYVERFEFLSSNDVLPDRNEFVIIRNPKLKRGDDNISIASGKFTWSEQQDAETSETSILITLRSEELPTTLRLSMSEWKTFRPLAVKLPD